MEINSCFNQDQDPAAFVRDWRTRKILPANKSINQDMAPIVRRKTVITIGCASQLQGSAYQPEDHTVSASEVGETACGRISITVKTLPKTAIRKIPQGPIFNCDLHGEEDWMPGNIVPFKSSSVSDPSWIYIPVKPDQLCIPKISQLTAWQDEQPSHDIGVTSVSNSFKASSKKSSPAIDIDVDQQFGNRKVTPGAIISELRSPKVCVKPTFNVIMSGESRMLHLEEQDAWSIEKDACKIEKSPISSISRSPIGYREWLKSLDRLEGESFPNQIHSTVDKKMKYQDGKQFTSAVKTASNSSSIIQQVENLSAPRSILKNGLHDCDYEIHQETIDVTRNQQYQNKVEMAKIVDEDKPTNSYVHNKQKLDWTNQRSTTSLVGWTATFNNITDSKFNKMNPTKETHLATFPKIEASMENREHFATRGNKMMSITSPHLMPLSVDSANPMDVININQMNAARSHSSSGCWKLNSSTQDGTSEPALSSGMDVGKATELVRQFFHAEDVDIQQSSSLVVDKMKLSSSNSNLSSENQQTRSIPHLSTAVPKQGSAQDHHRGRSPIKSKIPLRIPRPVSVSAFSNSSGLTLTAPALVEQGSNIASRSSALKAKGIPSKLRVPSAGRTRSVDSSRLSSPLSNYVLYSNVAMARGEMMSQ